MFNDRTQIVKIGIISSGERHDCQEQDNRYGANVARAETQGYESLVASSPATSPKEEVLVKC